MPQVDPVLPEGSGGASSSLTWNYINLATAALISPNSVLNGTPVAAGDNFYTLNIDAQTARTSPGVMDGLTIPLPGVTMAEAYVLLIMIWVLNESETGLILGGYACDDNTALGASNGVWAAQVREVIGVEGDVDGFSRLMSEARPSLSAETAQYAAVLLNFQHNPVTEAGYDAIYTCDSSGTVIPTGFEDYHGTPSEVVSPGTSGTMYIGGLAGAIGGGSATASADMRIGYALIPFP